MNDYFSTSDNNLAKANQIKSELIYGILNTSHKPFVSIMIPTYKRPELLKEAILSVLKQNNFNDYEIIVIDNDNTKEYSIEILEFIKSLNFDKILYYINEQNIGVFGNWNKCISLANGVFMTILSDDDYLLPNYLKEMTKYLLEDATINRVECKYIISDERTKKFRQKIKEVLKLIIGKDGYEVLGWRTKCAVFLHNKILSKPIKVIKPEMYLIGCFTAPHAQLYKVELARQIDGFKINYDPIADYVFNCHYASTFDNCIQIYEYLAVYRVLTNTSLNQDIINKCINGDINLTRFLLSKHNNLRNKILRYLYIKCRTDGNNFFKIIYYLYKLTYPLPF
jgi:glycosyltransferase involved in cell wall biosynthesis